MGAPRARGVAPVYRQFLCAEQSIENLIASHGLAAGAARVVDYGIGLVYFVAKHDCGELLLDVGRGAGGGPSLSQSSFGKSLVGQLPKFFVNCFVSAVYEVDIPVGAQAEA
jgi:hypothetical protein